MQNKFNETPIVLVTSEHLRTGKEYDASLIWTEDVTKSSFQVCLREMQNFDGKHENIDVVSACLHICLGNMSQRSYVHSLYTSCPLFGKKLSIYRSW